jgi:hypothetical protein
VGGVFAGGNIPFTFSGEGNRRVELTGPDNTEVEVEETGIYRVVYSVTATQSAAGFIQLLHNGTPVTESVITIQAGVNVNEIFLTLEEDDVLSLNLTGAVTLVSGKNASLLLERIA